VDQELTPTATGAPTIGLLPWGNVLEDFLEPTGLTLERFCDEFTGSWMFTWARALRTAGVRTEIACVSREARSEIRATHRPSGTPIIFLPTTPAYRVIDRRTAYPYGNSVRQVFGLKAEPRGHRRVLMEVAREVGPYVATPPVRLARAVRRGRWQAILCQEYEYPRFDVSVVLGRGLGVPVFGNFQGGTHQYGRLERILRPRAMALATGLMIGPEREFERVRDTYDVPPEKIARIVNPVDLDVWRPRDRAAARAELDLPADAQVVAWHGRVAISHKGIDVLLAAWRSLVQTEHGELRLLLIGGGSDAEEVARLIDDQRLPGVVRIDQHIHDTAQLSRHLSAADVYVMSSRHEGFPVALIEAMACGLPAVATDVTAVADILGRDEASAGLVVPTVDPEALAASLRRLVGDTELRRQLAERARRRAETGFSLEAVGAQLRDLLVGGDGR
jgi:starch synthase